MTLALLPACESRMVAIMNLDIMTVGFPVDQEVFACEQLRQSDWQDNTPRTDEKVTAQSAQCMKDSRLMFYAAMDGCVQTIACYKQ